MTAPRFRLIETQRFELVAERKVGKANWFSRAFEGLRLTFFGP